MAIKFPSIPDPGSDPATQAATLRALKQAVELLVANATGVTNSQGVGSSSQVFALNSDVQNALVSERNARTAAVSATNQNLTEVNISLQAAAAAAQADASHARSEATNAFNQLQNITQTVYSLSDAVGANTASITYETAARTTADSSITGDIKTLKAFTGTTNANYQQSNVTLADQTTSLASSITSLNSYVGYNGQAYNSNITQQLTTMNDPTAVGSLANLYTTLSSYIGSDPNKQLTATITQELITTANSATNSAQALDITKVGTIGYTVTQTSQAVKNIGAQYSVSIDSNGYVSGFQLISGGSQSAFKVNANQFIVGSGSTGVQVFSVNTSTNKVTINGSLIVGVAQSSTLTSGGSTPNIPVMQIDFDNAAITISDNT